MSDNFLEHHIPKMAKSKKLFIPTLSSWQAVSFWLGMVIFFSFYGVAVQFHHLHSFNDAFVIFFDFFVVQACIVYAIVGYIHFAADDYHRLSMESQVKRTLLATIILTPPATILGKVIEFLALNDIRIFEGIFIELIVNVGLALLITSLLLYYFRVQYYKIRQAQEKYNQKLIEQNEQLKARITPHFFFNMLNTLQYLSETDPEKSVALIGDISNLYRVSFANIKEIALTDEITLCEHYLNIEQYRFGNRLKIIWDLPDEDTLYDMVITSLTLQMIIEKIVLMIVEINIEIIHIVIQIRWENNIAAIDITANIPTTKTDNLDTRQTLTNGINFNNQVKNLQYYFGETANITYRIDYSQSPANFITQIRYPLIDTANSMLVDE